MKRSLAIGCAAVSMLAACEKPIPPTWQRMGQTAPCAEPGCDKPAFYLDTANISFKSGTPYVILQTRYGDGRFGMIRAEANCPRAKLEPTALKEDVFKADGTKLENRMLTISAEDERAVLDRACPKS